MAFRIPVKAFASLLKISRTPSSISLVPCVPELMGANMDSLSLRWLAVFRMCRLRVLWQFRQLVPLNGPIARFLVRIDSIYAILRQM